MKSKLAVSTAADRTRKRRILLVDDHPMMRQGLAGLINDQDDLMVCCQAGNAADALNSIMAGRPDLALIDISLEGKSGLELIRDIRALRPELRLLVLSMHDESIYAERALRAGAHGYVMKKSGGDVILAAIRKVLAGTIFVSEKMSRLIIDEFVGRRNSGKHSEIESLTDREFEVFKLIGDGCSIRDVAKRLHLSPKTVDVYRQRLKEKLGLADSVSLIQRAVRWVETEDRS